MALYVVTPPTVEPLSLAEAKLHLRVTTDDEDDLIESLILAAREQVEHDTGRACLTQTFDLKRDGFDCEMALPMPPAQSVTSLTYLDTAGDTQTLSTSYYRVLGTFTPSTGTANPHAVPATVVEAYGYVFPPTQAVPESVTIRFVCGYGDTADLVPASLKAAMKMLIGTWYTEGRQSVVATFAGAIQRVPDTVDRLVWPFKVWA